MRSILFTFFILASIVLPSSAQVKSNRINIFKDKTTIENPFDLRDPFRPPMFRLERKEGRSDNATMRDGTFTNITPVGDINLESLRIVGVMVGKERRALARVAGRPDVLVLREGMKLGRDNAELKAILPGGIILVEKLVNVYGEEEYLETVIPISQ